MSFYTPSFITHNQVVSWELLSGLYWCACSGKIAITGFPKGLDLVMEGLKLWSVTPELSIIRWLTLEQCLGSAEHSVNATSVLNPQSRHPNRVPVTAKVWWSALRRTRGFLAGAAEACAWPENRRAMASVWNEMAVSTFGAGVGDLDSDPHAQVASPVVRVLGIWALYAVSWQPQF